jgi:hypothetical protein
MFVQKPGRARPGVSNPRGIFYISALRRAKAVKIVSQSDAQNAADAKKDGAVAMDRAVAEIITSRCKPAIQDQLYGNPATDPSCPCGTCVANPPTPRPAHCRCSDCLPETSSEVYTPPPKAKRAASDIPQAQRLTKEMKTAGTIRLEEFRLQVWSNTSDPGMDFTPLADFLPDVTIRFILDNFARFKSTADISELVKNIAGMKNQHEQLYHVLLELAATFTQMKKDKAAAKASSQQPSQPSVPVVRCMYFVRFHRSYVIISILLIRFIPSLWP